MHEVDESRGVGGRRASKAAHEATCLAFRHELPGVDVRERRDPEGSLSDELGEDAPGAERDERAEDRVLDEAGQQLRAPGDHRLHDDGSADPVCGGSNGVGTRQVQGDAARFRLVCTRLARTSRRRGSRAIRQPRRRPRRLTRHDPGPAGIPYATSSSRVSAGSSQRSSECESARSTTTSAASRSTSSSDGHGAEWPPQPVGPLGGATERPGGGLGEREGSAAPPS